MTWAAIAVLAVGAYGFKVLGLVGLGRLVSGRIAVLVGLVPAALFAALVAVQTFDAGERLVIDARLAGVTVAALAAWRRLPFVAVVLAASVTTAIVRALA